VICVSVGQIAFRHSEREAQWTLAEQIMQMETAFGVKAVAWMKHYFCFELKPCS